MAVYIAFKLDYPWVVRKAAPCFKPFLRESLIHSEVIIEKRCTGRGCKMCAKSCDPHSKHRNPLKHYLNFFVSDDSPWVMVIDNTKYFDSEKWFYVKLPITLNDIAFIAFLQKQLDKPLNRKGMFRAFCRCSRSGVTRTTLEPDQMDSYFCSELITTAIREQLDLDVDPCTTSPIMLYEILLTTPGVVNLQQQHPSL